MTHGSDDYGKTITATAGRDAGKQFHIPEIPPTETVTFVLRLLGAVRLNGVDELLAIINGETGRSSETGGGESSPDEGRLAGVLRLLAGCDPDKVRALIADALDYMTIAPDQTNRMFRKLSVEDIKEKATLGTLLTEFVRINVMPAG